MSAKDSQLNWTEMVLMAGVTEVLRTRLWMLSWPQALFGLISCRELRPTKFQDFILNIINS